MNLISTGKSTVLSYFADLDTISAYVHANGETTDFQFFPESSIFVEVNKKSGLEVMRIKNFNDQASEIRQVRRLKFENAFCASCARQSQQEIAVGQINGLVKIYNYKDSELVHCYAGDKVGLLFLDYNDTDEYISAVHENGVINIYGTKTRVKIDSINIDSNSTLARFHPTKRFNLAIASYQGSVTNFDISSKRKIFHYVEAHSSPCSDLCMSPANQDTIVSVGYDCTINIFDARRRGQPKRLQLKHPLSTVSLSDCGIFFCVGNLKGELITFDMRNTKAQLCSKKVHDGIVSRVAFVPQLIKEEKYVSELCSSRDTAETINETSIADNVDSAPNNIDFRRTLGACKQRDSFYDFLNFQMNKEVEKTSSRLTAAGPRDSFDWEALRSKPSQISSLTSPQNNNSSFKLKRPSYSLGDSFERKISFEDVSTEDLSSKFQSSSVVVPLRERNASSLGNVQSNSCLKQISEEHLTPPIEKTETGKKSPNRKENKENSTKNSSSRIKFINPIDQSAPTKENSNDINDRILNSINDLRVDMEARFKHLEFELKFEMERNKWQMFSQTFDLWSQQIDSTGEIRDALATLLQTDPFVIEFKRLKEENQKLRAQVERLLLKKK